MASLRALVLPLVLPALLALSGCNRRVFEYVEPTCGPTGVIDVDVADEGVDILFVVDNSGSMREEQVEVARNMVNGDGSCPIVASDLADFRRCREPVDGVEPPAVCRFFNPSKEQLAGPLQSCGFLQVLAAFGTDFRVGVITTDVGRCDNRIPASLGGDDVGHRPQRGCLQPDGPDGRRFIARADLDSDDPAVRDIGGRFTRTLDQVGILGVPAERGLDAVDLFFADDTDRDVRCDADRDDFIRTDARLALIFLTDEEDCSRVGDDGPFTCAESETSCTERFAEFGDDICGEDTTPHLRGAGSACYDAASALTPVSVYAERFRALKARGSDVSVAVIAGAVAGDGGVVAGGCSTGGDGDAVAGCEPLRGRDRRTCPDCCLADAGTRYVELAGALAGVGGSICDASFRDTMIEIARFLGDTDVLRLADTPTNADLVLVIKDDALVPRLPGASCDGRDGWLFEDERSLRLCGSARPAPGERLSVRAPLPGLCDDDANAFDDGLGDADDP